MAQILVVEPEPEVRELFVRLLAHLGHQSASDDGPIDAVLVEPGDPRSKQRARELVSARPGLPVVCATIDESPDVAEGLSPVAILIKPFGVNRLREALERALNPG